MKRSQLINEAFLIMIRNKSLWIVALIALGINSLVNLILPTPSVMSSIISTLMSFAVTVFLTGSLIRMVDSIAERHAVTVIDGFEVGTRRFIPLLIVRVVLMLPIWIVLIFATGSFLSIFSEFGQPGGFQVFDIAAIDGAILGIVSLIMFLMMITSAISVGADRAVVLENLPIVDALKRGVQLLVKKFVDFIFIGMMMFVVVIAIGILVGCLSSTIALPLIYSDFEYGGAIDVPITPSAIPAGTVTSILIGAIISLIAGSLTTILFSAVWTLAFRQWQGKQPIIPRA